MKTSYLLKAIVLLLLCHTAFAQQGLHRKRKSSLGNFYWEYLPPGYDSTSTQKYPVIIFLHGCGEIAFYKDYCDEAKRTKYTSTNSTELNKVLLHGPPKEINSGSNNMCITNSSGVTECFLVISPQLNNGYFGTTWDPRRVDKFIEFVKNHYPVDKYRVYLTGLSLGGIGTWQYALRHPDKLAAIVPISGEAPGSSSLYCNLSKIPVWAFHDSTDNVVATSGTLNIEKGLKACTTPGKLTPRITLFKNYENGVTKPRHDIWSAAYSNEPSPVSTDTRKVVERPTEVPEGETIYKWFSTHKRTLIGPMVDVEEDKTVLTTSATITSTLLPHPESSSTVVSYNWVYVNSSCTPTTPTMSGTTTPTLTLSNLKNGTYRFRLTVRDDKGFVDTDEMVLTQSAKIFPGEIEAENYTAMAGIATQTTSDVPCSRNITNIDAGDYLDYNVDVKTTGSYIISYRVASGSETPSSFELRVGSTLLHTVNFTNTGGAQSWATVNMPVKLMAGTQLLRIHAVTGGWNLNWIQANAEKSIAGKIEAESFDTMFGIQTQTTTDLGGGSNIGYIDTGDWMDYFVNVKNTGTYNINYRVASNSTGTPTLELRNGNTVLHSVRVPYTGGWQKWTTVSAPAQLTAGNNILRIHVASGGWNINWWEATVAAAGRIGSEEISDNTITIYPNPSTSEINIIVPEENLTKTEVRIKNSFGLTISNPTIVSELNSLKINTQNLPSGTYVVEVVKDSKVILRRKAIIAK